MAPDLPITCLDYLDSVAACTFQEETEREECLWFARSRSVPMATQILKAPVDRCISGCRRRVLLSSQMLEPK